MPGSAMLSAASSNSLQLLLLITTKNTKHFFYLRVLRGKKYHSNSDTIAQKKPRRINRRGFSVKWLPACALRADSKSLTV
jgi:hypothetical protein